MKDTVVLLIALLFLSSEAYPATRSVTSFPVLVPATDDFVIMTDTTNSGLFSKVTFANFKTALSVQDADADLTDLADGSLTGTKVGFADTDNLFTASNIQAAVEEFNDSINAGAPNGTGAKVHWSQLLGVPAGFADGTDSEGVGGGYTNLTSFVDQTAWRVFYSNTAGDVTELALGADGTYLKSNGATSAPTWATPSGLSSLPTADNQLLQATGVGTYEWTSTLNGVGDFTGAGKYNNITITQPATGATLTLVEGSTLATSGAYSITLTSTGATNVTLPTSGTLATTSQFDTAKQDRIVAYFNNGTTELADNTKSIVTVPFNCTITGGQILASKALGTSGTVSAVVNIWHEATEANFDGASAHPAAADSICSAGTCPTVTTANLAAVSLTSWTTTTLTKGDILVFNVDSATDAVNAVVTLYVNKI